MSLSMWTIYHALLSSLPDSAPLRQVISSPIWTMALCEDGSAGIAMTTEGDTRPLSLPPRFHALPTEKLAAGIKSWNLVEASRSMAVINACYNTPARLDAMGCEEPFERYCTHGLDLSGKTVGVIGHLKMPQDALAGARQVYILERHPQPGDYPDSACEYLLPECDVVLITGSSLINKTLPRLLQLSERAYTILTGPTVPLCPALLRCGIDRLAGFVPTDAAALQEHITSGRAGPPYPYGKTFLLTKETL